MTDTLRPGPLTRTGWLTTALVIAGAGVWLWASPGTPDVANWLEWIRNAQLSGPIAGYAANNADYPPGAALLLWIAASIGTGLGADPRTSIKVLLTIAVSTAAALVLGGSRRLAPALLTVAATIVSAIGLVYLDALVAPFLLAAIWAAAAGRPRLLSVLLGTACAIKWQPLLVLPFALLHLRARWLTLPPPGRRREVRDVALIAAAFSGVLLLVYGWTVLLALARAFYHGALSNNAANLPWILGWLLRRLRPDDYGALWRGRIADITQAPAWLLFGLRSVSTALFGLILLRFARLADASAAAFVRFALAGSLAYFLVHAGAHENHLFLSAILACALAGLDRRWTLVAIAIVAAANLNLIAFYGVAGVGTRLAIGLDVTVWLALANCALGLALARPLLSRSPGSDARAALHARPRTAPTGTDSAAP